MVERNLPKVDVAGSSPVIRSKACLERAFCFNKKEDAYVVDAFGRGSVRRADRRRQAREELSEEARRKERPSG